MSRLSADDRQQILNALKRNVNGRQGWDLPPEWGAVYRADNGRMRCRAFPVPPAIWDRAGHPNNLLEMYRALLANPKNAQQRAQAATIRAQVPDSMAAMYLTCEGWAPPAHRARHLWEADKRPAFKDLPDRVELRTSGAVDLDSSVYMVVQPRNTMVLDGVVDDLTPGREVTGDQPELLYALLHLFTTSPKENQR